MSRQQVSLIKFTAIFETIYYVFTQPHEPGGQGQLPFMSQKLEKIEIFQAVTGNI